MINLHIEKQGAKKEFFILPFIGLGKMSNDPYAPNCLFLGWFRTFYTICKKSDYFAYITFLNQVSIHE